MHGDVAREEWEVTNGSSQVIQNYSAVFDQILHWAKFTIRQRIQSEQDGREVPLGVPVMIRVRAGVERVGRAGVCVIQSHRQYMTFMLSRIRSSTYADMDSDLLPTLHKNKPSVNALQMQREEDLPVSLTFETL